MRMTTLSQLPDDVLGYIVGMYVPLQALTQVSKRFKNLRDMVPVKCKCPKEYLTDENFRKRFNEIYDQRRTQIDLSGCDDVVDVSSLGSVHT